MPHLKTTEFMNWIRTKVCSSVHVWSDLKQLYFHHKFLIFHVWNCIPKNTFFFHLQLKIEKFFLLSICLLKQTPSLFVQFSSVTQLYPTFCDPMNHSTPGLPAITNSQSSLKLMSIKSDILDIHSAISSSIVPFSSFPLSLPASESFPMSQLFAWGRQSIGVSALASVLPKNTQDWSPLEWTGWISLQ